METAKVVAITGSILGGGSLTGLAIKYFPSSEKSETVSEETIQPQTTVKKKYNPRKITKEESEGYKAKFEKWTKENGTCALNIRMKGQDWGADHFANGAELDLDGIEEALQREEAKNKCTNNNSIYAEKREDGGWNFYDEKEATKLSIAYWSKQNGNCQIQIEENGIYKEVNSISASLKETLGEVLTYLVNDDEYKQSCEKGSILMFSKNDSGLEFKESTSSENP